MSAELWLKFIGWLLFSLPILAFTAFAVWMIKETMSDDDNIGVFVSIMLIMWLIGVGLLLFVYFSDFAIGKM